MEPVSQFKAANLDVRIYSKLQEMGQKAREFVKDNFLITRQLREYLTLMVALIHGCRDRIELG